MEGLYKMKAYDVVKNKETKEEFVITMIISHSGAASIMRLSDRQHFILPLKELDSDYKLVKEKKDGRKK